MARIENTGEPLERHEVTITYLEQTAPPRGNPPPPPAFRVALLKIEKPPLHFYRYLFDVVGTPHRWVSRRYMEDDALSALIHADTTTIYVLYKDGWPAGFCEFNGAAQDKLEVKFFGLVPDAQGTGLGRWFFREVLGLAWANDPKRLVIETCSADNPAALRLYQSMGFSPYSQGRGIIEWYG